MFEIYGVEYLLICWVEMFEIGEKLIVCIDWWKEYIVCSGVEMNNNFLVGNKVGGLIIIFEKLLGVVVKVGMINLCGVYEYVEFVIEYGMVFMDSFGYDLVFVMGQVVLGVNLICFIIGCGLVFGCVFVLLLKFLINIVIWLCQIEDMDLNCGSIIDGEVMIEELGEVIFQMMIDCVLGWKLKFEEYGYGQDEFVFWQIGVVI